MNRLRSLLAAAATLSMVFTTTGAAFAQGSGAWESRADFIYQLDKALGIKPVYPATPDFQDVSTSSPYYGYIEAAYQDGITNGVAPGIFGPSLPITRAEAAKYLVIAFGAGSAAGSITSTKFTDNSSIPTGLVGYVGEAAALGLMKGLPDGSFNPDGNLTVTEEGLLMSQIRSAMSALELTVTPSATDVAPGQIVQLKTSGATASGATVASPIVTYSLVGTTASGAVLTGSSFVGSTPGSYTVQAASGTSTATANIAVYGPAAALKVSVPATVVANGRASVTATVSIVDASGNVVGSSTDPITLNASTTAVAGFLNGSTLSTGSGTVDAVNGVATFTLTAGTVAGASEILTADDSVLGTAADRTATITGSPQVPTSVALTAASPYLTANAAGSSDELSAEVLDQTGSPMLSGSYTLSFQVTSGPANFSMAATAAGVYYGPSGAPATAYLNDVEGSTGPIVVTASATGLTSATANLTAVIAGTPAQIALSAAQTVAAGANATYTATVEDSHGYPVPYTGQIALSDSDTAGITAATAGISTTTLNFANQATETFTAFDKTEGSYTLTAATTAGDIQSLTGATTSLIVTAGSPTQVAVSPQTTDPFNLSGNYLGFPGGGNDAMLLPLSNPKFTATAQLEDTYGNPVSEAGVAVQFTLYGEYTFDASCSDIYFCSPIGFGPIGYATITSGTQSGNTDNPNTQSTLITAYTNASGLASASVDITAAYPGDTYLVDVHTPSLAKDIQTANVTLATNVPASYQVSASMGSIGGSETTTTTLVSGLSYTDSELDPFDARNNPSQWYDTVLITLGGTATATLIAPAGAPSGTVIPVPGTSNEYYFNNDNWDDFIIQPELAGTLTLSVQDLDVVNATPTTTSYTVVPGSTVGAIGFSSGGTAITSSAPLAVTAGVPVPITAAVQDSGGNPIISPNALPVYVTPDNVTGEFRSTASGVDVTAVPSGPVNYYLTPIAAGQLSTTFYFVPTTSGNVYFNVPSASIFTVTPTVNVHTVTFTVDDALGNPVTGAQLQFSLGGGPGTLSVTGAVTNSSGQATVTVSGVATGATVNLTGTVEGTTNSSTASFTY